MAVSGNQKVGKSVPPAVVAAAIAAFVAIAGIIGYKTLSPAAPEIAQVEPSAQAKEIGDFLALKAKESGGDINKLTPGDRDKLQQLTGGRGEQALFSYASRAGTAP